LSYFIYTDLISSLLDPRLVDSGSTLIHIGAYDRLLRFSWKNACYGYSLFANMNDLLNYYINKLLCWKQMEYLNLRMSECIFN